MRYWGTRWRRGILTKNWHWQAAMLARWGNWLLGRGFRTDAEYWRENKMEHRQGDDERGGRKRSSVTVWPATSPPTVAFSVWTVTAVSEIVTDCVVAPTSRF